MPTILRKHQRQTFTVVDNGVLGDERLSWKATGLLVYLLSRPDDWRIRETSLIGQKTDGRDGVRAGLRELETLGYLRRTKRQVKGGRWLTTVHVAESPDLLVDLADQPTLEIPSSDESADLPTLEKPTVGKAVVLSNTEDQVLQESDLLPSVVDPPRRRDEIWDALAEVFGDPTTESNRKLRGRVCRSLKGAGATGPEILRRAGAWPFHFGGTLDLTETALEKHWDRLGRAPLRASSVQVDAVSDEARARAREERAAELDRKAVGR